MEGFYQESGRAGRDRGNAISVTYYSTSDKEKKEFLMRQEHEKQKRTSNGATTGIDRVYEATQASFQSLVDMCAKAKCRRRAILVFFDEKPSFSEAKGCGNCDYCSNPEKVKRLINQFTGSTRSRRYNW